MSSLAAQAAKRWVTDPDGTSKDVWIDDSSAAPLQEEEAATVAEQWKIALPG